MTNLFFITTKQLNASSDDQSIFGVNVGMEIRYEPSEEQTVIAKLENLNLKWVREEFNWNIIEPSEGNFDWNGYDRIMQKYNQAEINVLGILAYSADWASTAPNNISTNRDKHPPISADWKNFVEAVVNRYPEVLHWEVWNEPNHEGFLVSENQVADYIAILQTASEAIRSENPNAKVITGGLSGSDSDFIRRLYLGGAKELFDIVAIHPYRINFGKSIYSPEEKQFGLNNLSNDIYIIRSMIRAYDPASPAPIWITELGWSTYSNGVSEEAQANYLQRSFIQSRMYPEVEKIFWYNLRDDVAGDDADKNFGLYAYDWRKKKSAKAIKQLATYYPTFVFQEDSELYSKPIEEFQNPERIFLEVHDDNRFIEKRSVVNHPDIRAFRGLGSITFHYQFANNTVPQFRRIVINDLPYFWYETFDLWLWGDGGIHSVRFRFKDSTGEIFQGNAGSTGYGWTRLNISLKVTSHNFVSWGGNNDQRVDFPVTLDSIIIDKNPESPIFEGDIVLSRFTYCRFDQAYSVRFQQAGRNIWAFWKKSGSPQVVSTYTPLSRVINMWNMNDSTFRSLEPTDLPYRDVIQFGLEEKPLFIQ